MSHTNSVLIVGKSGTGKSFSLRSLEEPEGVFYMGCDAGKRLPFKSAFKQQIISDPYQVHAFIEGAESYENIHTHVIDTITFMMDMYETQHVQGIKNTMKGWSNYRTFWNKLMQHMAQSSKNFILLSHNTDVFNDKEGVNETRVKLKGSVMNQGVEAYFSNVIATKKIKVSHLEDFKNDLLNITDKERKLGVKHVYQTQITADTLHECIKCPYDMWTEEETYIDNNAQLVIDRLNKYYE